MPSSEDLRVYMAQRTGAGHVAGGFQRSAIARLRCRRHRARRRLAPQPGGISPLTAIKTFDPGHSEIYRDPVRSHCRRRHAVRGSGDSMVDPTRRRPRPIGRECNLGRQGVDRGLHFDDSALCSRGSRVGTTLCGHLPEITARRVRWRLPPPPPSPPDARTPGSRGANSAFFFEFQVIAADLGRVPKKTRRGRGKAAASVQRIVSRTGFRGPGLGASADSGGRRFGLRNPERSTGSRCTYASRHPRYPGVIPCYPGYKTFDRAQGGDSVSPPDRLGRGCR